MMLHDKRSVRAASPVARDLWTRRSALALVFALAAPLHAAIVGDLAADDPRNIRNGLPIPAQNYCDQPYVVVASNGEWVVVLTTGTGEEGSPGQHVVSARSADQGRTWSALADIEPPTGPEASWAVPLLTPHGRLYAFYTYNGDRITNLPGNTARIRADMLGWYCFKSSDDNGRTWSAQRYRIPLPITACDLTNQWGGAVQVFWGIDKPKVQNGVVRFGFTKLGRYMLDQGEGWVITSDNLLTERDPDQLRFAVLPDGDRGIRNAAFGSVQEEHNLVPLDGDDLFCAYRLNELTPAQSVSRDGGHTWSLPARMTYGPGQRTLKQPRACPKLFKTADGRFLFWFHNHSGQSFESRNPVFLSGGLLHADGVIRWSEPEVVLFDPTVGTRMSYPDLIEQDGRYWLTETQKTVARVHEIDPTLLYGLWGQATNRTVCAAGLLDDASAQAFGRLEGRGLSLELLVTLSSDVPGQTLFRKTDATGRGVTVATALAADGSPALALTLSDGVRSVTWDTDPGRLRRDWPHHAVFLCDFAAGLITVLLDGRLADGALRRQYGWGRIPASLEAVAVTNAAVTVSVVRACRLYNRALRTSEAVGNYRSFDLPEAPQDEFAPRSLACWPLDVANGLLRLSNAVNSAYALTPIKKAPGVTNAHFAAAVPNPDRTPWYAGDPCANAGAVFYDASRAGGYLVASNLGSRVELTVPFTVEGWVCRTSDPGVDLWYVAGAREIGTGWMLSLRRNNDAIGYHLHVNGQGIDATFPGGDVTQNPGWQHLALVYDPVRGALGVWELFLNGVSAGAFTNAVSPGTHGVTAFNLGGRAFSAANTYCGLFDFWRVSSGVRTPAAFLCTPPPTGTLMRVLLLKPTASQTKDSHG